MTATNFDSVWRRIIHDPWKATFSAVVAILLVASVWHLYLDYLTEPLIPEDYRSAAMEVFTLNDVSFYHIKGSFNHKWVSTAINEKHVTSVLRPTKHQHGTGRGEQYRHIRAVRSTPGLPRGHV